MYAALLISCSANVYMNDCVYVHIYNIYIYIYTYTYTYTYTHTSYMQACMCMYTCFTNIYLQAVTCE